MLSIVRKTLFPPAKGFASCKISFTLILLSVYFSLLFRLTELEGYGEISQANVSVGSYFAWLFAPFFYQSLYSMIIGTIVLYSLRNVAERERGSRKFAVQVLLTYFINEVLCIAWATMYDYTSSGPFAFMVSSFVLYAYYSPPIHKVMILKIKVTEKWIVFILILQLWLLNTSSTPCFLSGLLSGLPFTSPTFSKAQMPLSVYSTMKNMFGPLLDTASTYFSHTETAEIIPQEEQAELTDEQREILELVQAQLVHQQQHQHRPHRHRRHRHRRREETHTQEQSQTEEQTQEEVETKELNFEEKVSLLVSMGFEDTEAMNALNNHNGDINAAVSSLVV